VKPKFKLQSQLNIISFTKIPEESMAQKRLRITALIGCRWLTPVVLATQEAEIRRIAVQSHPG
jgi:hypothetical protein